MKKLLVIFLTLSILLAFAACGDSNNKTAFDPKSASDKLLADAEFVDCKLQDNDDIELEFDITLEDTESFYFAEYTGSKTSANMFMIAKAKEGSESLMKGELEKLEKTYASSWVDSNYPEKQAEANKVKARFSYYKDGIYVCIVAEDSDAMAELIGLK